MKKKMPIVKKSDAFTKRVKEACAKSNDIFKSAGIRRAQFLYAPKRTLVVRFAFWILLRSGAQIRTKFSPIIKSKR